MKIYDGRESFYQWDVNQKITSPKLKEGDEVHFGNSKSGEAIVVEAYKYNYTVVADVPNIILQETKKVVAYRYVTDGEGKRTIHEKTFDVVARPKPADYVYTETEALLVYDFVRSALLEAKENGDFNGSDGLTPYIGENGNWWIGEEDTGVKASNAEAIQAETIQDVNELPSTDINEKSFYRLITVTFIHNRHVVDNSVCYCVDGLPEKGIPATDNKQSINAYYNIQDGEIWGYLDSNLSKMFGFPIGWYKVQNLLPAAGWAYGGIITDEKNDPKDSVIRALIKHVTYSYKNGKWTLVSDFDVNEWLYPAMIKEQGYWLYSYNNLDLKNPRPNVIFSSYQVNPDHEWQIPERKNGIMKCATPIDPEDCSNKEYVDDFADAILAGLNEIIAAQNKILGG